MFPLRCRCHMSRVTCHMSPVTGYQSQQPQPETFCLLTELNLVKLPHYAQQAVSQRPKNPKEKKTLQGQTPKNLQRYSNIRDIFLDQKSPAPICTVGCLQRSKNSKNISKHKNIIANTKIQTKNTKRYSNISNIFFDQKSPVHQEACFWQWHRHRDNSRTLEVIFLVHI